MEQTLTTGFYLLDHFGRRIAWIYTYVIHTLLTIGVSAISTFLVYLLMSSHRTTTGAILGLMALFAICILLRANLWMRHALKQLD